MSPVEKQLPDNSTVVLYDKPSCDGRLQPKQIAAMPCMNCKTYDPNTGVCKNFCEFQSEYSLKALLNRLKVGSWSREPFTLFVHEMIDDAEKVALATKLFEEVKNDFYVNGK